MVIMANIEPKNAFPARLRLQRVALFASVAALAGACGGGDPGSDQITLGTGQGQGADPITVDFPIFYTKRPVPTRQSQMQRPPNVLRTRVFDSGVDLYMRASASPSAVETNLTGALTKGLGDVRDVDVSFDGRKVIFAMRFPFRPNTQEQNQRQSWDIYEYDIPSATLRPLLVDPPAPSNDAPKFNDRFPHYLPDGRIVFSSSRQRTAQAVLLDENKPQYQAQDENDQEPALNLHIMDKDGGGIRQISFNQSHDLDSAVMSNGQIVFSRWDGAGNTDHVALYKMNPDGSGLELLYGKQNATHAIGLVRPATPNGIPLTNNVVQFLSPRQLQDGRILALIRPFTGTEEAGDLVSIDLSTYVENTQPTLPNAGMSGPAFARVPATTVYTNPETTRTNDPGYSPGGRYRSAYPLPDGSNRLLVSWSQCRLTTIPLDTAGQYDPNAEFDPAALKLPCTDRNLADPTLMAAAPLYGIYIYDLSQGTQIPIVLPEEGFIYGDVVAAAPRTIPPVILDRVAGLDYAQTLNTQASGIIDIKSVYDLDGMDSAPGGITGIRNPANASVTTRPAAFLRVEKAVSLPDDDVRDIDNTAFGPTGRFMREILGYAPIEPDGSVRVRVPANVPIQLTMIDRNARRISPLHRNWLQVQVGEVMTCNGCHTPNSPTANPRSHGRSNLFASVNPGAPASGLFPNTDSALQGNASETMAQARARRMCFLTPGPSACSLSVDVIYNDLWTNPVTAGRAKDASFDYCYSAGATDIANDAGDPTIKHVCQTTLGTPAPTSPACERNWGGTCRVVINYPTHIQPLWDLDRISGTANNKCTTCHAPQNGMNQAQVPAGQLDLSNTASVDVPERYTSYQKLLFNHNAQELNATMTLQDVCLQTDPTTGVCIQFQVVSGSMSAANARISRFFTAVNAASHAGFLSVAEQRLISEWLDIGAQYYNDPFLAPEN